MLCFLLALCTQPWALPLESRQIISYKFCLHFLVQTWDGLVSPFFFIFAIGSSTYFLSIPSFMIIRRPLRLRKIMRVPYSKIFCPRNKP